MSALTLPSSAVQSMTSREIAELTGKEHKNVLRDIGNLLKALGSELSLGISEAYEGDPAHGYRYFILDRDATYCLVAGYDPVARMRIIKRWQELETKTLALPDFSDPVAAARAWADAYEAKQIAEQKSLTLTHQIEEDKPYVDLARAITGSSTMTRRDWLGLMKDEHGLNISEKKLTAFLTDEGYLYKDQLTKQSRAYAKHSGLFKLEVEVINGFKRTLLKITGDGVLKLTPIVLAHFNSANS